MFSIDGLASGLDTTKIIDGLLSIQQRRGDLLNARKQKLVSEQTAFKGIESRLIALQAASAGLSRSRNNAIGDRTAVSSHENLLEAAAGNGAAKGVYTLRVNGLATAHQIASQGYADVEAGITTGTLTVQVGDGQAATVTIDGTNNTLQGLADAINAATDDVVATIVNTGSGATPYRLMLTGATTGAANAIAVTNNLAASSGDSAKPDFSGAALQTAADASLTLGSGAGALTVAREANEIDDLIDGLTLKLHDADPGQDITVTVAQDTQSAKAAINSFVTAFNDLMQSIDERVRFDAESGQASVLLGNRSALSLQDEVRASVTGSVANVKSQMNRLSALGITVSDQGRLVLNSAKLDDALAGGVEGVSEADVRRLFALDGQSDHAGIRFVLGSAATKASNTNYQVDITQAAERATVLAGSALAETTTIDGSNNTLSLTVDGQTSATLTLTAGSYSQSQLAAHLQEVIDADAELSGRSVRVTVESGRLRITSDSYGSSSEITIGAGTALGDLKFTLGQTDAGQDVAGRFLVNGVEETAQGTGQILVGEDDNANTAGLQLRITLTSSQVVPGAEANLTVTRGIASRLEQTLSQMLDPVDGRLKGINDAVQDRVSKIDEEVQRLNDLIDSRRDSLVRQFAALEDAISRMQSTSSFLSAQLGNLTNLRVSG